MVRKTRQNDGMSAEVRVHPGRVPMLATTQAQRKGVVFGRNATIQPDRVT